MAIGITLEGEFRVIWLRGKRTLRIPALTSVVKPKPTFKKPHGTTFKRELTQFAVAHARAVRLELKEAGKKYSYDIAAWIAVRNLTNDAYYKDDEINFYKDMDRHKLTLKIIKELGQNRI